MYTRDKNFYDLVNGGLASLGYTGANGFNAFVNDMFAEKYNLDSFDNIGFPVNPDIPLNPTYEQIEVNVHPYTMAANVDIDSDGPTKSPEGLTLNMGKLPTFKHEVVLSRKIIREKMLLAEQLGGTNAAIDNTIADVLFNGVDDLLGGNYNTIGYLRHQVVSNEGKVVLDATNNPLGIPLELDFKVPAKNKVTSTWYKKTSSALTQDSKVGTTVDPVKVVRDLKRKAQQADFAPSLHIEMSKTTFDDLISLPYFRSMYSVANRPDITDAAQQVAFGNLIGDDVMKAFLESIFGMKIVVVDACSTVEKYNKSTQSVEFTSLESFKEGVLAIVPDGAIGDIQFGQPLVMQTPNARVAMYDGGRTLIRQLFNDETMTQVVKSEFTGLVVPNKVRWMYYITIKD